MVVVVSTAVVVVAIDVVVDDLDVVVVAWLSEPHAAATSSRVSRRLILLINKTSSRFGG
jgi:hypothetical protein